MQSVEPKLKPAAPRVGKRRPCAVIVGLALLGGAAPAAADPRYESRVTARVLETPREDRAADASVLTDSRTPRSNESVAQLVSELPGVTVNRLGGIGSTALISLRGSTWEQVGVYVDGIPLNSAIGGGVDLSTLPLGDVERIEVYRGTSPIGFGASALGGIVSITTRAARSTGVGVELGAGSFNTYSAGLRGSYASERLRIYVGAHALSSQGTFLYITDGGTAFNPGSRREVERANNAVAQLDGVARVTYAVTPGRDLTAEALVFFRDKGLPGFGSIRQTTESSLRSLRFLGSLVYDSARDLGRDSRLRAQVFYSIGRQQLRDPLGELSSRRPDTDDRGYTIGAIARASRPVGSFLLLSAILDGRYEQYSPYDASQQPAQGSPSTRLFGGAGVEADFLWRRLRLHVIPAARIEAVQDARSGRSSLGRQLDGAPALTNAIPSGRLALIEEPAPFLTLRANAARYARLPSMTELFGDTGFILGNPELRPESGWNTDAGAQARLGRGDLSARVEATFFASFVDDLIQFQQDAYGRASAANLARARILGVEGTLDASLTRFARLKVNGAFTDARDVSRSALGAREPQLPNRPRYRIYARPEARLPLGRELLVGAYFEVDYSDRNYLDPANLVAIPTRLVFGAGLYAEAVRARLLITASAQNLGDARVFDFAGYPLPSRAFFLSARFRISKETAP